MSRAITSFFCPIICCVLLGPSVHAAQPLLNGDFETGSIVGWIDSSTNGGVVRIAQRNGCFSSGDTTQIRIRGQYAALLRSGNSGPSSMAGLTSPAFTAGDGIAFIALSESARGLKKPSVDFSVEILDASNDAVVISQKINTAKAELNQGCPGDAKNIPFQSHYISTRAFIGSGIKIRFVQNTNIKGSNFFTLVDQVILFNQGEQPIFRSRPHPQAGINETSWGTPYLDSAGSFDPDISTKKLSYSWYIDSEEVREFKDPCVADLADGNHAAVLYVNDGQYALSDVIHFVIDVPDDMRSDFTAQTPSNTFASINPVAQDPECSTELPDYEVEVNSPDVDVNDHLAIEDSETTESSEDTENADATASTSTISAQFRTTDTGSAASSNASISSANRSTLFTEATDITISGIRWKPVSESDGKLVVLTPSSFPEQTTLLIGPDDVTIEIASSSGRTNGDRVTYRFNRPGSAYPNNIVLRVGNTDYQVVNPGADIR